MLSICTGSRKLSFIVHVAINAILYRDEIERDASRQTFNYLQDTRCEQSINQLNAANAHNLANKGEDYYDKFIILIAPANTKDPTAAS
jgi:hypothetical protein